MSDPKAMSIVEAVGSRLEAILTAGGYNTNAGNNVHIGRDRFNHEATVTNPVLNVYSTGDDPIPETEFTNANLFLNLAVQVDGFVRRQSGVDIHETVHLLIADIKKAVLLVSDKKIGGLTFGLYYAGASIEYPEEGSQQASVSVQFTIPYGETYGDPTT